MAIRAGVDFPCSCLRGMLSFECLVTFPQSKGDPQAISYHLSGVAKCEYCGRTESLPQEGITMHTDVLEEGGFRKTAAKLTQEGEEFMKQLDAVSDMEI